MESTVAGLRFDHCAAAFNRPLHARDPHAPSAVALAAGTIGVCGARSAAAAPAVIGAADCTLLARRAQAAEGFRHKHRRAA